MSLPRAGATFLLLAHALPHHISLAALGAALVPVRQARPQHVP